MTLENWQDYLHTLYQGDDSTPSEGSTDWDSRLILLKASIALWNSEKGILWNELFVQLSDASDGDKTVVAATVDYDCPTDFLFLATYVRTTSSAGEHTFWEVVKPAKAEIFKNESAQICWITGNKKVGYNLHFGKQPTAGHTINYGYYKEPYEPSAAADVIEMSNPWFGIHYALSILKELDGLGDSATLELGIANAMISSMKTKNIMPPWLQDNQVPDKDFEVGRGGFGK